MNHGGVEERLAALGRAFEVFGKAARATEPAERAFDDPAFGLHDEPLLSWRFRDDFAGPCPLHPGVRHRLVEVRVAPDLLEPFDFTVQRLDQSDAAHAVLHARGQDQRGPHQSERINREESLAAVDFFSPRRSREGRLARSS